MHIADERNSYRYSLHLLHTVLHCIARSAHIQYTFNSFYSWKIEFNHMIHMKTSINTITWHRTAISYWPTYWRSIGRPKLTNDTLIFRDYFAIWKQQKKNKAKTSKFITIVSYRAWDGYAKESVNQPSSQIKPESKLRTSTNSQIFKQLMGDQSKCAPTIHWTKFNSVFSALFVPLFDFWVVVCYNFQCMIVKFLFI